MGGVICDLWGILIVRNRILPLSGYTTLGYGDLIMTQSWRLLGPLEAANGMLMFGVSTALIFALIQRMLQARFKDLEVYG